MIAIAALEVGVRQHFWRMANASALAGRRRDVLSLLQRGVPQLEESWRQRLPRWVNRRLSAGIQPGTLWRTMAPLRLTL